MGAMTLWQLDGFWVDEGFFGLFGHFSRSSGCPGVERQFFEPSSTHTCECSRAPANWLLAAFKIVHVWIDTYVNVVSKTTTTTTIIQSGEAPF